MGQLITVEKAPSALVNTHIFHLNRSLTGMEIETYTADDDLGPSDDAAKVIAKRILDLGATSVTIYSNVVTVICDPTKFKEIEDKVLYEIENLYRYYGEGAGWAPDAH